MSGGTAAPDERLVLRCVRFAYANWALEELLTARESYGDVKRLLDANQKPTAEAERAIHLACPADDLRAAYAVKMTRRCTGSQADCRAKKRLADKMESLIVSDASESDLKREMEDFFAKNPL